MKFTKRGPDLPRPLFFLPDHVSNFTLFQFTNYCCALFLFGIVLSLHLACKNKLANAQFKDCTASRVCSKPGTTRSFACVKSHIIAFWPRSRKKRALQKRQRQKKWGDYSSTLPACGLDQIHLDTHQVQSTSLPLHSRWRENRTI